jgi:hypothetical protein
MNPSQVIFWKRKIMPIAAGFLLSAGAVLICRESKQEPYAASVHPTKANTYPGLDLQDPSASFVTVQYVAGTGGDESTRSQAIVWLDQQARSNQPLTPLQEAWLLDVLTAGGHPQWTKEYKFLLFNSAFNTLHPSSRQEDLSRLLMHLAAHDPEQTMRLYAIQHLEVQRIAGRLAGALANEIRALFLNIAAKPGGQEAGLAIRCLSEWNDSQSTPDPDVITQALALASSQSLAVDVRVSALHAAGTAALPLARTLASDINQPLLVRKSAISCIGDYGSAADESELEKLSTESTRLAQATSPALSVIRSRQTSPNKEKLTPF